MTKVKIDTKKLMGFNAGKPVAGSKIGDVKLPSAIGTVKGDPI